jgi:hypothetical protein
MTHSFKSTTKFILGSFIIIFAIIGIPIGAPAWVPALFEAMKGKSS